MATLTKVASMLLVTLTLIASYHGLAAGEEMTIVSMEPPESGLDMVTTTTIGKWGYKPYFAWWPVDYCAWDYSTTGVWQVTFTGGVCNGAYGTKLAQHARKTMTTGRGFKGIMQLGASPVTTAVMCARSSTAGLITYTVQAKAPSTMAGRQMMKLLRSTKGGGVATLARNMYTAGVTRTIGGLPKGTYKRDCSLLSAAHDDQ